MSAVSGIPNFSLMIYFNGYTLSFHEWHGYEIKKKQSVKSHKKAANYETNLFCGMESTIHSSPKFCLQYI